MKGLTVFYNTEQKWQDMVEVFQKSWERHMDIPLEVLDLTPPPQGKRIYGLDTNTDKLEVWLDNFTEDTIFCDCDMLVRADITDGFEYVKNIGYTIRTTKGRPFNAGIIFARYTDYSKRFMQAWVRANKQMYNNDKLRKEYVRKIPGMNQPALAYIFDKGWKADPVPEEYNICDADRWTQGKMVHIKSEARNICFHPHRRFHREDYQKSLHKTFWAYLGNRNRKARTRNIIEARKVERREKLRRRRR